MNLHRNALIRGYRLNQYSILGILGQGGFGITYLAEDREKNEKVAIKEYLPGGLVVREADMSVHPVSGSHSDKYEWGLERFLNEARLLKRFSHPNIVRVLNEMQANGTAYMIMAYEDGEGFNDLLRREKTLSEARLREILWPILDGLMDVHATGFIHRDLKPANIFIRSSGSPVLLDFGSARHALGRHTRTLTALVSPGFAPFEQYTGNGDLQGPWTDIYGLGGTLYRTATGRPPADAMDRSMALLNTGRDNYVPAGEIQPAGYSDSFLAAIDHALNFQAELRPQSVAAWRGEFDRIVRIPARKPVTRHPASHADAPSDEAETCLNLDETVTAG